MQRYKQLSPFDVRFTRTNKTCTEKNELQYSIQNDTAYNNIQHNINNILQPRYQPSSAISDVTSSMTSSV